MSLNLLFSMRINHLCMFLLVIYYTDNVVKETFEAQLLAVRMVLLGSKVEPISIIN